MNGRVIGWAVLALVPVCAAYILWQIAAGWREHRAKRAIEEAARIAAHLERRRQAHAWATGRRTGQRPAAHPEQVRPLGAAQEDWLARLARDLWPDGRYAVKRDGE